MARTGATITRGGGGSGGSGAAVSAWSTASRRPIVSVSGLTRSKGRVSHAGSTVTGPASAPPGPARRPLRRDEAGQVVAQPLGVEASGGDHEQRGALGERGQCGGDHRLGGLGDGDGGVGRADEAGRGGVAAQQAGDGGQAAGPGGPACRRYSGRGSRWGRRASSLSVGSEWHHSMAASMPSAAMCSTASAAVCTEVAQELAHRLGRPAQDVRRALGRARGLAHPDAHAQEVRRVQVRLHRAQPVVTGQAAPRLQPDRARGRSSSSCTITMEAGSSIPNRVASPRTANPESFM